MAYLTETEDEINLADVWSAVKIHLKSICKVTFIAVLLMGIVTYFWIPKKYQSSVSFYINEKGSSRITSMLSSQLGSLGGFLPGMGGSTNADLCSDIILARQFVERVLEAEGLPHEPEDIEKFQKKVKVVVGKSGVVTIAVLEMSPELAYRLAQRIFDQYQDVVENEIYRNNNSNRLFIEEQLAKSEARLERAEEKLLVYQQEKGVLLLPEQATQAIAFFAEMEKGRMEVTVALEEARQALGEAERMLTKNDAGVKESVRAAVNPVLQEYKLKLTEVEVELAQLRENLTDEHPKVKSLLAQREELIFKMQQEDEFISSPEIAGEYLKGLVQVAGLEARQESLNKIYKETKAQLDKLPEGLLQYGQLVREREVAERIYILLVSQLEQARIAEENEQNVQIQVIDAPVIPHRKHSPSTAVNMMITLLLVGFLGVGAAVFKERELVFGQAQRTESY